MQTPSQKFSLPCLSAWLLQALVLTLLLSLPAGAQSNLFYEGVPPWALPETDIKIDFRERLYFDTTLGQQAYSETVPDFDRFLWRAKMFGLNIHFGRQLSLFSEFEIARDSIQPFELYLDWEPIPGTKLRLGNFIPFVSLNNATGFGAQTFMEFASVVTALSEGRRFGLGALHFQDNWQISGSLQAGGMEGLNIRDQGLSAALRFSFAPVLSAEDREFIHLGLSVRHRWSGPNLLAYRLRPFMNAAPAILSTPAFAHNDNFLGIEAAFGKDHYHLEAEYALLRAEGKDGPAVFDSGYLQLGWLLTGESPVYDVRSGRLSRIRPKAPLGQDGWGALELALRFDWTRLSDQQISGGRQASTTFAINWYLTDHIKLALNYVDSSVKSGSFGDGRSQLVGARVQIDW